MTSSPDIPATQLTLLGRLANAEDHEAWSEFVTRYGGVLRRWCRSWKLSEADADDVIQNILLELSLHIRKFRPTGRFRGWLKTVARRAWYDYTQRRAAIGKAVGGDEVLNFLRSEAALDDFTEKLDAEANLELVELAMQSVRQHVTEAAWQAFHLTTIEQLSGAEVAKRIGTTVGNVYVSTCRVKRLLQKEVLRLEGES